MKSYKVIILGCGASGSMCAISSKEKKIAILDCSTKPAKKIMVTGNGRCNLTNKNVCSDCYNVNIDKYLKKFNPNDTLNFFESIGLEHFSDEEGRIYPISNSAKSVVDVLTERLDKNNIFLENKVMSISKQGEKFVVETDKEEFSADKLVVATGGNSSEILKNLGLGFSPFIPSLVALRCKDTRDLNGVKVSDVRVTATNKKEQRKSEIGEVLFKEGGVSGIVIFNLSTLFSRINNFEGKIEIDLLPKMSHSELFEKLKKRKQLGNRMDKFFVGMFHNAIANEIFKQAKINTNGSSKKLTDSEIEKMVNSIKNLHFEVVGCYDNNQVFSGGVNLCDLDENLMSKQIKNLYFCGEIVNVDGVCGGYNLQWAWTSGHIVGESL